MSLKNQKVFNIIMVLLSWSSVSLLGIHHLKKFFPATILIVILEMLHARIGKKRKYWVFYNKPNSFLFNELPYSTGPFIFISLWTLKIAYGDFKKFILLNGLVHAFFAFPITYLAKKFRYYRLVRINNVQFFLYFFSKSFILYLFQYIFGNNKVLTKER
ncbi:hypothetical protein CJ195_02190 [Bacillus sp. UMB0899]|nr:hypothetical protein CJ195_02190 [Bacillus sp. UMB0899]